MFDVTDHFIKRLRLRYNLELTNELYIDLCKAATLRNGILLECSVKNEQIIETWSLIVFSRRIRVVLNRTNPCFITALPYEAPVLERRFIQKIRASIKKQKPTY